MSEKRRSLVIDVETSGLHAWRDELYMCGIYDGEKYQCLRQPWQLRNLLGTVYKDWDLCGQRVTFDTKFLKVKGWLDEDTTDTVHDTRIMASLLRDKVPKAYLKQYEDERKLLNKTKTVPFRPGSLNSLKVLAPWFLKIPPFWEPDGHNYDDETYNEKDCIYTKGLERNFETKLKEEGSWQFYLDKLLPWNEMLHQMEMKGISIDLAELDRLEAELRSQHIQLGQELDQIWDEAHKKYRKQQLEELRSKYNAMCETALAKRSLKPRTGTTEEGIRSRYSALFVQAVSQVPERINYASPDQVSWLLRDQLGLDITDFDGEESTGKAVLNRLAQEGRADVAKFLEWRKVDKILTMYIPTYRDLQVEGIIHPGFDLVGTRTGRTSSSGPNMQQVPPILQGLFKPRPGYKFVKYDLSGIEAALIALYSGDPELYRILSLKESIHDHNAILMFNLMCAPSEVSSLYPRQRKVVKNIGFACFYGAGWKRIQQTFAAGGFPITPKEAKEKLALLKKKYAKVFEYHREVTEIFERGETMISLLGRPVTIQPDENPYMQGFNTLIQVSASDINLEACHDSIRTCEMESIVWSPLLVVHDCILGEAKDEHVLEANRILKDSMTRFNLTSANGPIKLEAEGGVYAVWE